jgi:hypothetical protein
MRRPTTALKKVAARASPPLVFSSFPFFLLTLLFMDPWLAVKWGGSTAGPLVGAQIYALHAWICAPLSSRRRSMVAVGQRPRQPPRKLPTRALHRAACPSSSSAWGSRVLLPRVRPSALASERSSTWARATQQPHVLGLAWQGQGHQGRRQHRHRLPRHQTSGCDDGGILSGAWRPPLCCWPGRHMWTCVPLACVLVWLNEPRSSAPFAQSDEDALWCGVPSIRACAGALGARFGCEHASGGVACPWVFLYACVRGALSLAAVMPTVGLCAHERPPPMPLSLAVFIR